MSDVLIALADMRARWIALIDAQGWGDQLDGDIQNIDDAADEITRLRAELDAARAEIERMRPKRVELPEPAWDIDGIDVSGEDDAARSGEEKA